LPAREQFASAAGYYAVALHELGHWTGRADRLNRDLSNPFGSEAYAREELRAEIASLILGSELGIGYDPGPFLARFREQRPLVEAAALDMNNRAKVEAVAREKYL